MFYSLLNVAASWTEFIQNMVEAGGISEDQQSLLTTVFNIISIVLWVALAIVGAIGSVYAIYLSDQLARADEQGKRDDAKKHLITTIIAVGVTLALILVFNVFLPMLLDAFNVGQSVNEGGGQEGQGQGAITLLTNMIACRV